jgi:uncharacterized HAD superfamily protein
MLSVACNRQILERDIMSYDIGKSLGISEKKPSIWNCVYQNNILAAALQIPDAVEGVKKLKKFRLIFITTRPESTRSQTELWLDSNRLKYKNLYFINGEDKEIWDGPVDILVEENLERAIQNACTGIYSILLGT